MNRRTVLALVAAGAIGCTAIGWIAGQRIKSPAEVAANTAAPEPSLITVPIEQRALSSNVVIRGQAEFDDAIDLSVSGSSFGASIITRLPKENGDQLSEGDVAIEVAGRPVIVLQGELPGFRSLTPTLEGPDVLQLEEALQRLGHNPGTVDGVFDAQTEEAVASLYRDAGYKPDEPTSDELASVTAAQDSVDSAKDSVRQAQSSVNQSGISESTRLSLDQSVRQATQGLDDAKALTSADNAVAAAITAGAKADLDAATAAQDLASGRFAKAEAGTHPDTGETPTAEEVIALQESVTAASQTAAEAESIYDQAVTDENLVKLVSSRTLTEAETGLAIQVASRKETLANGNGSDASAGLTDARKRLAEAQERLGKVQAEVGVEFPINELIFVPTLPKEVQRVSVKVGEEPQGAVMRVTGQGVVIRSAVSAADRPLISVGAEATLDNTDLGLSFPATVTFVATSAGTGSDSASDRFAVSFSPDEPLPPEAIDLNYRVTIPIESTSGEVLVVPLAALSAGSDGSPRLEIETIVGETEILVVNTGLSSQGYVEVTGTDGRVLEKGERVVVGRNNSFSLDDSDDSDSDDSDSGDGDPGDGGSGDAGSEEDG